MIKNFFYKRPLIDYGVLMDNSKHTRNKRDKSRFE